jgi:arsenite methyltransferase
VKPRLLAGCVPLRRAPSSRAVIQMKDAMDETPRFVRETYGQIAVENGDCCSSSCCQHDDAETSSTRTSARFGYRDTDLTAVPQRSNLGLGCGNPHSLAQLQAGETVLDFGS